MATYSSIEALLKDLQKKIDDSLKNEVYEAVVKTEQEAISDVVFTFEPKVYNRRDEYGLDDSQNMTNDVQDGTLCVENTAFFNDEYDSSSFGFELASLVEYGDEHDGNVYDYPIGENAPKFMKPRPFTEETRQRLKESRDHVKALKAGLERQGIKIE